MLSFALVYLTCYWTLAVGAKEAAPLRLQRRSSRLLQSAVCC